LRTADGDIFGGAVIFRDVTERKRLEEENRRYRTLVEQASDGIFIVDQTGSFVELNPIACSMLGYEREHLLSLNIRDLIVAEDIAANPIQLNEILKGKTLQKERWVRRKDGTTFPIEVSARMLDDGKIQGIVRDITKRKKAEEALRASEQRFSIAFNASPVSITISTLDEGLYLYANDAFVRTSGYKREEVVGRTAFDIDFWREEEDRQQAVQILREHGNLRDLEVQYRNAHGETRTGLLAADVIELDGKECMLAVLNDITERKRAEKIQLATYQISEAANSAENLQSLFHSIHEIVGELLPAENFYIALYDQKTDELSFPYFVDKYDERPRPRKFGKGFTEAVIGSGRPLHRPLDHMQESLDKGEAQLIGTPSEDWFGVPLKTKDRTIGALVVQSYKEGLRFGEEETRILGYVSTQVAMAIERKRAEDALRASEELFSKAFHSSPDPMTISTLDDGRYLDVNDSFLNLVGFAREEIIGTKAADNGLWDSPEKRQNLIEWLSNDGSIRGLETEFYTRSGEPHVLLLSGEIIELGGRRCALLTGTDITVRKRAEKERTESLARERIARAEAESVRREWQATFDAMTDSVVLLDSQDNLIRANRAFYSKIGKLPEEVVGHQFSEIVHREDRFSSDSDNCPVCTMRRKREHGVIELPAGIVTGYPIVVTVDPIVDENNNTVGVIEVIRDLSELYEARAEAERERVSLNAALEQMDEGMIIFDNTGAVIRANQRALQIFGFTLEDVTMTRPESLVPGRYIDDNGHSIPISELPAQKAIREGRSIENQAWYTRPDGQKLLVQQTASPFFDEKNRTAGAIVLARDVTEQQREHERAQQADKLRALGQLASGVAHNFNNALAAVIGYTQLALPKVTNTDVEKYLLIVEQSAKDAARMVERIHNFSHAGPSPRGFVAVKLFDIVRDAIDITRPRWRDDAGALGIRYEVGCDWKARESLAVNGEASELREVFVNIIFNALDAMPTGGIISIKASEQDSEITVEVSDTGGGMTEEIKRRVFEPFFTTKGVSGMGMGLAESYRIIERHSGRIEVESQLHQGTVFTVSLPVTPNPASVTWNKTGEQIASPLQILVVDDEKYVRSVMADMLISIGHKVKVAASAEEAIELVKTSDFSVVFTDLAMPDIDGIAATARIKELKPQVKVIVMSGHGAEKAYELAGDSVSIDGAISKPFQMEEIKKALNACNV
jgi:PAS domain S-box-containing protein